MHIPDDLFEDDILIDLAIFVIEWSVVVLQCSFIVAFFIFNVVIIVVLGDDELV